jgi:hypothetical protein
MDRNEYLDKTQILFDKWNRESKYDDKFVKDGILDFEIWKNQKPKILFLLLETYGAYSNIGETYSESGKVNINEGTGSFFWWNISRWKYAINKIFHDRNSFPQLPDNCNLNPKIDDIAIVDIKKKNENKSNTYLPEIQHYAKKDKEFLKEQITLINPDIIFCGSTFNYLKIIFDKEIFQPISNKNKRNFYKLNNRLIIDFFHPSCRQKIKPYNEICNDLNNLNVFEHFNW